MKTLRKLTFILALMACAASCGTRHEAKDYRVCAWVWPSCHDDSLGRTNWEQGIGEWEVIQKGDPRYEGHYQPKRPLWGYEMDNDPKVVEKWIDTALEHGVNTFIYDWYWFDHYPYLESALNDGFLKAPNCQKMDFYIMWANHDVPRCYWNYHKWGDDDSILWYGAVGMEDFKLIVERVIRQYFTQPNYVKVNGCPVFAIFDLQIFTNGFGSPEKAAEAMDYMRAEVRKAGFPDLHLQMVHGGVPYPTPEKIAEVQSLIDNLGVASMVGYNPGGFDTDYVNMNCGAVGIREVWNDVLDIPVYPTVAVGWDDTPRFPKKGKDDVIHEHATPETFKTFLHVAKEYADRNADTQEKFVMINAWNEWVEGSYLLPDEVWGYQYLDAVKSVFVEGK